MSGITGPKSLLLWQEQEVFAGILLGTEQAPRGDEDIDTKKSDGSYELTYGERKEKTQAGKWQCRHKFAVVMRGVTL